MWSGAVYRLLKMIQRQVGRQWINCENQKSWNEQFIVNMNQPAPFPEERFVLQDSRFCINCRHVLKYDGSFFWISGSHQHQNGLITGKWWLVEWIQAND